MVSTATSMNSSSTPTGSTSTGEATQPTLSNPIPATIPNPEVIVAIESSNEDSCKRAAVGAPGKSEAWKHSVKVQRKNNKGEVIHFAICNYCKAELPCHPIRNGTSSILHHLRKVCKTSPLYIKGSDSTQSVLTNKTMGGQIAPHTFNQKRLELKVVQFVIKDEQPFRVVEGEGFVEMMNEAVPRFKIPNRRNVATMIWDLFIQEKSKIFEMMRDKRVSITTDTWTSVQNINYMVVTAHFLDNDWKLHKRIINFTKITSHKGEDIGRLLEGCLKGWGVQRVFTITVDNASSNDVAIDYMKRRFEEMGTLLLGGKYMHLRCACHILNLIVKNGLKELASSIEGIRNCVKYIHSSGARLDKFSEFAILLGMNKMSCVPMDVSTRWNSTYKMLENAYKFQKVFSRMAEENVQFWIYFLEEEKDSHKNMVKRVGPPTEGDWDLVLSFVHFLKKFYNYTLTLSASKTPTANHLWNSIVEIQIEIDAKMWDMRNPTLQKVASSMKVKFNKYWGSLDNVNPLIYLGQVLNPCFKLQMITIHLKTLGWDQIKIDEIHKAIKKTLLDLYNVYKGNNMVETSEENNQENEVLEEGCEDNDDVGKTMLLALINERRDQRLTEITNEVDKYLVAPFQNPLSKDFDLLSWWRSNEHDLPILSKIAKDIFAIPTSTVASESTFSLGRRIVDPFRASLTPKMVEALVCTSDWLRADSFCFYKDPTEDALEFYKELEEVESSLGNAQSICENAS